MQHVPRKTVMITGFDLLINIYCLLSCMCTVVPEILMWMNYDYDLLPASFDSFLFYLFDCFVRT